MSNGLDRDQAQQFAGPDLGPNCLPMLSDMSRQTVQIQIRLLLEEQSDQGLHCLLFHLLHFDKIPLRLCLNFR